MEGRLFLLTHLRIVKRPSLNLFPQKSPSPHKRFDSGFSLGQNSFHAVRQWGKSFILWLQRAGHMKARAFISGMGWVCRHRAATCLQTPWHASGSETLLYQISFARLKVQRYQSLQQRWENHGPPCHPGPWQCQSTEYRFNKSLDLTPLCELCKNSPCYDPKELEWVEYLDRPKMVLGTFHVMISFTSYHEPST